ncbi:MAG: phosphoglucosamine mutase [Actinomyces sp.]|jgi:phosphoglucosamine mutase|nr:phosphoglucosamine mutase [Actinomyces sp.]MCI1641338.1 phosphoglucosamine mutase [Actinomyces sp.]MCI1662242.1 phosphoglucosamine mutase [Actinomyces sp.]MCI1691033.1 phosphoglucosamine mutase [Actinomyces sp.]MCI1787518.1 phosphoglucosamine mutase [Actinomyces sp.]MCI1829212.1 phosphoglucosamine mutase [Actinomyces sp.]
MGRLFGTDGVRGLANRELTAELALQLGEAAARRIGGGPRSDGSKPRAVIGRDTRISGEFLDHALAAGLASAGMDVVRIGVVTTPTVAHLTATQDDVDLGVMISASHNPMPDNGIKFFGRGGFKLADAVEDEIQELLGSPWERPTGADVGEVDYEDDWAEKSYVTHLVESAGTDLRGLRIAVDCANGGASFLGPQALREAGADVVVINASPDGRNINARAGSTHPEQIQAATVAARADFGVAFDGDADRCLAVDRAGRLIDGDKIMGSLAVFMRDAGTLDHDTLVVTVMSNLGLILAMRDVGIRTVQTAVGDRYVLEKMLEGGYALGGEQSGHVIARRHATTGDGVLTALLLARMVHQTGRDLGDLTAFVRRLPQTLINVRGVDKTRVAADGPLSEAVAAAERDLGETGRVVLRSSGTEPLVRVMVEAATQESADAVASSLAGIVKERLSL